ncbi:MAG: hypothetical protein HYV27_04950 [Candidatus Hydrogenedentes bacterium]|nr:hypothetical protein [Candidatus Hydrogenedentota bacterium]
MSQRPIENPMQIQIVAGAIMASVIVHAVVGVYLTRGEIIEPGGLLQADESMRDAIGGVLVLTGLGAAALSFVLRRFMARRFAAEGATLQTIAQAVIVSLAFAEAPGIMGLLLALLTGELALPGLLWGTSFAVSLFHFPTRAWIENCQAGERR